MQYTIDKGAQSETKKRFIAAAITLAITVSVPAVTAWLYNPDEVFPEAIAAGIYDGSSESEQSVATSSSSPTTGILNNETSMPGSNSPITTPIPPQINNETPPEEFVAPQPTAPIVGGRGGGNAPTTEPTTPDTNTPTDSPDTEEPIDELPDTDAAEPSPSEPTEPLPEEPADPLPLPEEPVEEPVAPLPSPSEPTEPLPEEPADPLPEPDEVIPEEEELLPETNIEPETDLNPDEGVSAGLDINAGETEASLDVELKPEENLDELVDAEVDLSL